MKWLRCLFLGHVWRFRYAERSAYAIHVYADGRQSYGFGPRHLGDQCKHCGKWKA